MSAKARGPDDLGGAEFAGGLLAKGVAVDDEADPAEAFDVQQAVEERDRELGLAGAGRHRDQHLALVLGQRLLDLLDGLALIGPQREAELEGLGLERSWAASRSVSNSAFRPSGVNQSTRARRRLVSLRASRNQMPLSVSSCLR